MKMQRKWMGRMLAGCMAVSALMFQAGALDASQNPAVPTSTPAVQQNVTPSTAVKLNAGTSAEIEPWAVYTGYGNWKIHVMNNSNSRMTVKIHKDSPTGVLVCDPMYIPAGGRQSFYSAEGSALSNGVYYLDIYTDGTCNLNGMLFYKFGTTHQSLFV